MTEAPSFARSPSFDEETPRSDKAPSTGKSGTPFFADYVMDLSEAHDLAETPDPTKPQFDVSNAHSSRIESIQVPSLGVALNKTVEEPDDVASDTENGDDHRSFNRISNIEMDLRNLPPPQSVPRWPRDIPWAVAFLVFVPLSAIVPILDWRRNNVPSPLAVHPLSTASLHALFWAGIATLILSRALYRTPGGGDGDDARHMVGAALTIAAPISVAANILLVVIILYACPHARIGAVIPLWYTVRDLYLFRRWRRRNQQSGAGSRQAFFQALTSMVLDILSRSLRRASFFRVLTLILAIQFGALIIWRWALLASLNQPLYVFMIALVGFKWATGTIARMLSLLASGGIMSWFSQQARLAQELPSPSVDRNDSEDPAEDIENDAYITDAYTTVDASVYQSVADMDDVLDDDYDVDDDEFMEAPSARDARRRDSVQRDSIMTHSTVKSILHGGLTVSFGSVCQCGLVGGIAQFVWSQVRKIEFSRSLIQRHRNNNGENGFRGMQVHGADYSLGAKMYDNAIFLARSFVRRFSDLAMCHVVLFYKSYQRAALDVATLVEESGKLGWRAALFSIILISLTFLCLGVEPILHDDISTHMCACVGGCISSIIVVVTGLLLLHQRKNFEPPISDGQVVTNMIAAFVFSYTMIFTVMEPLRASIKAVYVSFAQHPESLSRAFPIVYHRLHRLSSENR